MGIYGVHDPNFSHKIAEGKAGQSTEFIKSIVSDPLAPFYRMIVLETISDPAIIDFEKISYWKNVIGVSNSKYAGMLPRNTIIAQKLPTALSSVTPPMFLFPFFPSHLALPCKPGEMVWAMFENPNAPIKEIGYWFCRITEPHVADDVNHTHHALQLDMELNEGTADRFERATFSTENVEDAENENSENVNLEEAFFGKIPVYELRNGLVVKKKDGTRNVTFNSELINTEDEEVFERLVTETDASKMHTYEDVPRFKKRPGDVVLEGSNNTLIVLGTDRNGPVALYDRTVKEQKPPVALVPEHPPFDLTGSAGSIDLVAGRGFDVATSPIPTKVARIADGEQLFRTIAKTPRATESNPFEGDPNYVTDRSRVLISQRTMTDKNFGIDDYMRSNYIIEDAPTGNASVVIKSDKIRIIARQDIALLVKTASPITPVDTVSGSLGQELREKTYLIDSEDTNLWASIVIKTDGNIVFTPSVEGYVKLGGDDASKAILCTEFDADQNKTPGELSALPIATTGGGFVGTAGGNVDENAVKFLSLPDKGAFSKKVLIK